VSLDGCATFVTAGGGEAMPLPRAAGGRNTSSLTCGWLMLGKHAEAERAAGYAAGSPRRPVWTWLCVGASTEAAVALESGEAARAAEAALNSTASCEAVGAIVEAASRTLAGALAQSGDRERAVVELEWQLPHLRITTRCVSPPGRA
jgi:hypothetical protein